MFDMNKEPVVIEAENSTERKCGP